MTISITSEHLERLKTEEAELASKVSRLVSFMGGPVFLGLTEVERNLMDNQQSVMGAYLSILRHRITFYEEQKMPKEEPMIRSHWFCAVEVDIPEGEMPSGCDALPRRAVEKAIMRVHPEAKIGEFASGWGLSEKGFRRVCNISCSESACISQEQATRRG